MQQYDPSLLDKLTAGKPIDIWREPNSKDESSWRAPAEIIKPMRSQGKATVQWRGYPILTPLRHCQLHIDLVWLLTIYLSDGNQLTGVFKAHMDLVDDLFPGQVFTYGRQWNRDAEEYVLVPPDLESRP